VAVWIPSAMRFPFRGPLPASYGGLHRLRNYRTSQTLKDALTCWPKVKVSGGFITKLRLFLVSLGIVMPLPEGNRYLRDAKILGFIAKVASNLYRDNQLNLLGVERKSGNSLMSN